MKYSTRHHVDPVPSREEELNDYYNEDWDLGGPLVALRRGRNGKTGKPGNRQSARRS